MEIKFKPENIIIIVTAIICILISVLDFLDALDSLPWIANRIPIIILLTLGLVTINLLNERNRNVKKLEEMLISYNHKILEYIVKEENNKAILDSINDIWSKREKIIESIFYKSSLIKKSDGYESLRRFLNTCEKSIELCEIFDQKLLKPWDVNIAAIDYEGKFIYHINEWAISMIPPMQYPIEIILQQHTGKSLWINRVPGKLNAQKNFPFKKNLRFTRIDFCDIKHLKAIIIFESHINILPDLPNTEKYKEENKK